MLLLTSWVRCITGHRYLIKRYVSTIATVAKEANDVKCHAKLFRYVQLRSSRTVTLNSRNLSSYTASLESVSQVTNNLFEKNVLRLESNISRLGRVYLSDVERLLQDLKVEDVLLDKRKNGILLLQCCGSLLPDVPLTTRLNLVHEVWETLFRLGVPLSVDHYNALLQSYVENGHRISATEFLSKMQDVNPNETTYQLLLACICEAGDVEQAMNVISRMKTEGFPLNETAFNSLMLGHARARDIASATALLDTMQTARIPITADTYTALMKGFLEAGNLNKMKEIYQEAKSVNVSLSEMHWMDIIKSAAISGRQELIPEIIELMPEGSIDLTPTVTNMAIHLVHLGCERGAYYLLCVVPLDSVYIAKDDESSFGAFIIHEMVKANRPAQNIVEICDLLATSGRNNRSLYKATEVALIMNRIDLAFFLFKALKERNATLRPHFFWPIILYLVKQDGEKGIFRVLRQMKELDVNVDYDTLVDYILPYTSLGSPDSLIRKLQRHDLQLRELLTPVLVVLLKNNQLNAAIQLCIKYHSPVDPEKLLLPLVDAYIFTRDLRSAVAFLKTMISISDKRHYDCGGQFILELLTSPKNGNKNFGEIVEMFQRERIPISSLASDIISNHFAQKGSSIRDFENNKGVLASLVQPELKVPTSELFDQHIPHPRDMNLEELEFHLVELKSKNMNTRGILRRLLQQHVQLGNVERVLEIKKEFEAANYEFSPGMQASLFDMYVRLGRLNAAESCLNELLRIYPNFNLDDYKIVNFATLLVADNKYRGAVAILEKHVKVRGGPSISRNCWKLLQTIAEEGEPQKVRHMLEHLLRLGYCNISNVLLGPLVRAHFIQGSLLGAVKEYKRCVAEYKVTPLQHELLCRLVSVTDPTDENTKLLQEVMEATESIHGSDSVHVGLAIAIAEAGTVKQLHNLVKNPSFKIRPAYLIARCKKLADEDKLAALENIAAVSKGIKNLNRAALYSLMLKVYSQRGDSDGALSLWTTLQEQDISPGNGFLTTLASLLKSHKREIPFVVPDNTNKR